MFILCASCAFSLIRRPFKQLLTPWLPHNWTAAMWFTWGWPWRPSESNSSFKYSSNSNYAHVSPLLCKIYLLQWLQFKVLAFTQLFMMLFWRQPIFNCFYQTSMIWNSISLFFEIQKALKPGFLQRPGVNKFEGIPDTSIVMWLFLI